LPTMDEVFALHQIVGSTSTRRKITRKSVDYREQRKRHQPVLWDRLGLLSEGLRETKRKAG